MSNLRVLLCLSAVAALTYLPAFQNGWVMDDGYVISQNRDLDIPILEWIFGADYFIFSRELTYRPVVSLTHVLDRWWGLAVGHALNLALHAVTCTVLYALGKSLFGRSAALWGTLLFLVHPAYSEAVYVITFREDLLCGVFLASAFWAALRAKTFWSALFFGAALLSKETAVGFPFLVTAVYLLSPRRGERNEVRGADGVGGNPPPSPQPSPAGGGRGGVLIALFAVDIAYAVIRIAVLPGPGLFAAPRQIPWLVEQAGVWTGYVKILFFPSVLSIDHAAATSLPLSIGWIGPAVLLAFAASSFLCFARRSISCVFGFWFFVFLLPVAGIVPLTNASAERYLYIPSIFLALGAGCLIQRGLQAAHLYYLLAGLAVILLFSLGVRTHLRGRDFRDSRTLYTKELDIHPNSKLSTWGLGRIEFSAGNYEESRRWLTRVLELDPLFYPAFIDLGRVERAAGRSDESERWFSAAYAAAPTDPEAILSLAEAKRLKGDTATAEQLYREAARYPPHPLGLNQRVLDFHREVRGHFF